MNLEILPNEILLDVFNYIDGTDLLHAFYGLNDRFSSLLYELYRNYHFQFNSVLKRHFDQTCQHHFPYIVDRITALSLSDSNNTPGQINLFFSYISSLNQFIHLRALTIRWVRSYNLLMKILDECHQIPNLTHLSFYFCYFHADEIDFQLIINNIWNLPKLHHCNFDVNIKGQQFFCIPTIISTSLKHLSIYGSKLKFNQINQLFEYTPYLKRLSICTDSYIDENYIPSSFPILTRLNINNYYLSDISKMIILLQSLSNLRCLDINLMSNLIDGHQWEPIIRHDLPKLKIFRLKMTKAFHFDRFIQQQANELIDSFRNAFWISEHQWYVRCLTKKKTIHLYTLSTNTSNQFEEIFYDSWKSTYPLDNQQKLHIRMTSIYDELFFEQSIPFHINLSNLESLWIKFPLNNQFWSLVPSLKRLDSLKVSSYTDTYHCQLQALLDRTSHLYHLTIQRDSSSLPEHMLLFKQTDASIRRLDLTSYKHCFTETECILLSYSSLGMQCEILSIVISNRECIIKLIKNMFKLQALHVQLECEKYDKQQQPLLIENIDHRYDLNKNKKNIEIIQWLKDHLPSTCSIITNPDSINNISIWI